MAIQQEPLEGRRPSTLARWPSGGCRWGQTAVHHCQTAMRLMMESVVDLNKKEHTLRKEKELLEKQIKAMGNANDVSNKVTLNVECDNTDELGGRHDTGAN
ncbi:unnamed protein product, partial [Sphenostylis stenocarpa]